MMKFIEAPDLHFSPQWADTTEQCINRIAETAEEREVDFIALPGDLYNRPIYATERGGFNQLREMVRRLTRICPVVAVYGTPSHEPPGSLEALADVGLTVLEPGKMYGFYYDHDVGHITTINPNSGYMNPDTLLFGVPELSKKNIQATLRLSADEANAETVNMFRRYITEFVAPHRAKHQDIPAVMLMHGTVSDSSRENSDDVIIRASDIVIHTEDFRQANLDRVSLGHIHTPWESQVISAGYAGYSGIDENPWGKTGFPPAMNVVKMLEGIQQKLYSKEPAEKSLYAEITRIPYGTPERRKIIQPLSQYYPTIAYWLNTDDPNATLPENVHPWSRVTYDENRQETRRVTREQAETVKKLSDLFRLIDPDVTDAIISKVDTIESIIGMQDRAPIDVSLESIEVSGCVFFKGKTMKFDLSNIHAGVNGIIGGNGTGKSSVLSFCSPYPVVIGKDTASGRISAIKDFFSEPDSFIHKRANVNGSTHEHHITIRGAHTQSPKVECYLTIDGVPQLEKGTFDEMMTACEDLYGPFNDYLLTTFYVQPLQGKTGSSLMSATMTDIRDLVQSIAGIDRESEKRYALDKVSETEKEISRLESWLSGVQELTVDIDELKSKKSEYAKILNDFKTELEIITINGKHLKTDYDNIVARRHETEAEQKRKADDMKRLFDLQTQRKDKTVQLADCTGAAEQLEQNERKLSADDDAIKHNRARIDVVAENTRLRRGHDAAVEDDQRNADNMNADLKRAHETAIQEQQDAISRCDAEIKSLNAQLERINKPCPKCGYIADDISKQIEKINTEIKTASDLHFKAGEILREIKEPEYIPYSNIQEPEYSDIPDELTMLSTDARQDLETDIKTGREAAARIPAIEERIKEIDAEISDIGSREYMIDETIFDKEREAERSLNESREKYQLVQNGITETTTKISGLDEEMRRAEELAGKIEQANNDIKRHTTDNGHWTYISRMLQPAKIPALELDLVLDNIDAEASRIIGPFEDERYSFRTETQQQGKTGTVDRFDIKIHDALTGKEKSFLAHSPGEKAFFNDAYVKALVRQRNDRAKRMYDPVIMDESDGPIQPERVPAYYAMQNNYWQAARVLVVSHSPASHEHIENKIEVEDLLQ